MTTLLGMQHGAAPIRENETRAVYAVAENTQTLRAQAELLRSSIQNADRIC